MKKLTLLFAFLCASVMGWATAEGEYMGTQNASYANQFKWYSLSGATAPDYVDIIQAKNDKYGIYVNVGTDLFDGVKYNGVAVAAADLENYYAKQGAGAWFYVDQFTTKCTTVEVTYGGTVVRGFRIQNDNGTGDACETGGGGSAFDPASIDWDNVDFITGQSQYKIYFTEENRPSNWQTINIQTAPWASNNTGIYVTTPDGISACSLGDKVGCWIEGAQVLMYLSAFDDEVTEVTITHASGTKTLYVYNANTGSGSSTPPASPYCETEIKHQNLDNAAANSHVLLSVGSDGKGHTIVDFKPTSSNAVKFDYINIVGKKDVGYDIDNAADGLDEMSMVFHTPDADGDGNITFLVQWSYSGWGGRYEYNVTVPANAVCEHAVPFPGEDHLYCKYTDKNLRKNNANVEVTWSTNSAGDVIIELFDGEGASNTHFRNEGFEYGGKTMDASWMVYSGTNHQTSECASTYFTVEQATNGGNTYALRKKDGVTLPSGAIIAFVGHAFSWKNDQDGGAYTTAEQFGYTYGAACPFLAAPTNVAVDGTKHITFDGVANAQTYTANVYLDGIIKHRQTVSSGDVLTFQPYTTGTYQVQVVADASGFPTSDPSAAYNWALNAQDVVVGNSEYCEWALPTFVADNVNYNANLTVETNDAGTITITLLPLSGQTAVFRGEQGMKLSDFSVGTAHAAASAYFDKTYTAGGSTVVLTLKNASIKPGLGEKIYFNGYVECTVNGTSTWPNTSLEYTYGAKCSGQKHVTVAVNNGTMGSATVNSATDVYVDENTQVTCVATPNEGYDFVNWTVGGAEVSTSATYTPTISINTDLVANFEVHRITYCRTAITADNGATVYMTAKATGSFQDVTNYPQYRLEFEGMEGYAITGAGNFDVNITHVNGNSGNTGFGGSAWTFVNDPTNYPYGMGYIEFYAENWREITFSNHYFFFAPGGVVTLNNNFPAHINWSNTCTDENAPIMAAPTATPIDATTIRLTLSATDDYSNTIRYHVVCAAAGIDENIDDASGKTVTKNYTGLTSGTTYEFTITAADGTTGSAHVSAPQVCSATPVGDLEAPEITSFTATPSYGYVDLAMTATDDMATNLTFTITYGTENAEVEGAPGVAVTKRIYATPGTAYTFSVVATDAASHTSGADEVQATTLTIPAAPAPTHDARLVYSIYSDAYTPVVAQNFWRSNYGSPAPLAENDYLIYRMTNNTIVWGNDGQTGSIHPTDAALTDGTNFGLDVTNMTYLHFDVWCDVSDQLNTLNLNDNGVAIATTRTVAGEWVSFDVPLTGYNLADKQNLRFFKFHPFNATNCLVAIDNVYFYAVPENINFENDTESGNTAIITAKHKHFANATINRTFTETDEWYTLCLPFDLSNEQLETAFGAGYTLAEMTGAEDRGSLIHLNFDNVHALEAGKAYLLRPSTSVTSAPTFAGVQIKNVDPHALRSANDYMEFEGTFNNKLLDSDDQRFVGPDNYLYMPATNGTTMKAFRCFFTIPAGPQQNNVMSKRAKIVFGPQQTTDIDLLNEEPNTNGKFLINGELYIIRDGKTYNAQGQLVK